MSHEDVELKSPFPVIPPLKDSKWNDLPQSPDAQSQPVAPPILYPDIGELHPCPYFVGPDLNFVRPGNRKKKVVPTPIIPPPVISSPAFSSSEEDEMMALCLQDCLHGVAWEFVAEQGRDMAKETFCAKVSSYPQEYILERRTVLALWRKISKKIDANNWTEPHQLPIDNLNLDVLCAQSCKLNKAHLTVANEGLDDFHRKTTTRATSDNLLDLYSSDLEKKLKKQDAKDLKQQPPRTAS